MKYDCCFAQGNNWFRYRTGGILIHNNRMLFVKSAIGKHKNTGKLERCTSNSEFIELGGIIQ